MTKAKRKERENRLAPIKEKIMELKRTVNCADFDKLLQEAEDTNLNDNEFEEVINKLKLLIQKAEKYIRKLKSPVQTIQENEQGNGGRKKRGR